MIERTVTIKNRVGLHARPAAELVKLTGGYDSDIKITKDDLTVDGKSIMGIMMLAAEYGSSVELHIEGTDENEAMQAVVGFLESDTEAGE